MNTKYYRFIYQNVQEGVCATGSMAEAGETKAGSRYDFLYLSGGSNSREKEEEQRIREAGHKNHFHAMIVADFEGLTVRRAVRALELCQIDRVYYPGMEEKDRAMLAEECERSGYFTKEEFAFIKDTAKYLKEKQTDGEAVEEKREWSRLGHRFRLFTAGKGRRKSLVFHHESDGFHPKTEECIMNVKPMTAHRCCRPFVDPDNLNCEMRCMLHQDFTLCKKQNQKNGEYFVDGHLLPGAADLSEAVNRIKEEDADTLRRLRVIALPERAEKEQWMEALADCGTEHFAQYVIGTEKTEEGIIKSVIKENAYRRFVMTGKESGLCISGYYTNR